MPRSVGNLRLDVGRRVDAVDDEQGQKGEEPEAFNDALTRILQPFDPNMSVGTNSGLYDSSASKPKYLSIVAGGATKEAVESTNASSFLWKTMAWSACLSAPRGRQYARSRAATRTRTSM